MAAGAWPIAGHWPSFRRDPIAALHSGQATHGSVFQLRLGFRPVTVLIGPSLGPTVAVESIHRLRYRLGYTGVIDVANTLVPLIIGMAAHTLLGGPEDAVQDVRVLVGKWDAGRVLADVLTQTDLKRRDRIEALDEALRAHPLALVAAGTTTRALHHGGYEIDRGTRLLIAPPPAAFTRPALKVMLTMLLRDFDLKLIDTWRERVRYRRLLR